MCYHPRWGRRAIQRPPQERQARGAPMSEVRKIVFRHREIAMTRAARFGALSFPRAAIGGLLVKALNIGAMTLVTMALVLFALSSAHGSFASSPFAIAALIMLAPLAGQAGIAGQNLSAAVPDRHSSRAGGQHLASRRLRMRRLLPGEGSCSSSASQPQKSNSSTPRGRLVDNAGVLRGGVVRQDGVASVDARGSVSRGLRGVAREVGNDGASRKGENCRPARA
jgi:hypothetical protein